MLRPDAGIVEPCANAVRERNLAIVILQDETLRPLQHAQAPHFGIGEASGVRAAVNTMAARLHTNQPHLLVLQKGIEDAHRVAAAANARHNRIGQPTRPLRPILYLANRLAPDDALEVAHHRRIGVRPQDAAQQIMRAAHIRHPIADRLVDGVLERLAAAFHATHLGSQQPHAEDIGLLARHVHHAHVDDALDAQFGRHRGRGDAVLARARLGYNARLVHLARHQQRLPQRVVDLVRARVRQILALEVDLRAAQVLA